MAILNDLDDGFFTSFSIGDMAIFLPISLQTDFTKNRSHVLIGKYRTALAGWNFTFTDQDNRKKVIKNVYGTEVKELNYVSYAYTKWLMANGFTVVRYLAVAKQLRDNISIFDEASMSIEQKEVLIAYDRFCVTTTEAFDIAANTMTDSDTKRMAEAAKELRKNGDTLYKIFEGIEKPALATGQYWYADRMINEVDVNFR